MHFLTDKATNKTIDGAWIKGFETNSPAAYESLEEWVHRFFDFFGDMKTGDVIELEMVPGVGTTATCNGDERGVVEGDDFGTALLGVWLGGNPPSDDLKAGMLGF